MTAPKPADPLADLKRRLDFAVSDLERAAGDAREAVAALMPEEDAEDDPKDAPHGPLLAAVQCWHDEEHDGPLRWCLHPVCREAQS